MSYEFSPLPIWQMYTAYMAYYNVIQLKCFFLGFGKLFVLVETDLGNDEQNMLDLTNW